MRQNKFYLRISLYENLGNLYPLKVLIRACETLVLKIWGQ